MPYRNHPEELRPSAQALALVKLWQDDAQSHSPPSGEDLAQWWIDQGFDLDDDRLSPLMPTQKWRQLARHVHLWAYIHDAQHIDLVGMELGIENDWIPEPGLTFDSQGQLVNIIWKAPLHLYARPPLGFRSWQLPLSCIGYERPAWRDAPLRGAQQGRAHGNGSWWC